MNALMPSSALNSEASPFGEQAWGTKWSIGQSKWSINPSPKAPLIDQGLLQYIGAWGNCNVQLQQFVTYESMGYQLRLMCCKCSATRYYTYNYVASVDIDSLKFDIMQFCLEHRHEEIVSIKLPPAGTNPVEVEEAEWPFKVKFKSSSVAKPEPEPQKTFLVCVGDFTHKRKFRK